VYSEQFDDNWVKTRTTLTANNTTAPDGSANADKVIEITTSGGNNELYQYDAQIGVALCYKCICKENTARWLLGTND
jgi:hypothetical protein